MVITQTPFRMSFFGGGTDFPDHFRRYGGSVLSTTFDKYCYVSVRHLPRFFDYRNELIYSKIERVQHTSDIIHPAIRNAMQMMDMHELRLTYDADLPARSGLGTSSAFAVGMLNAFHALKGRYAGKRQLADEARRLERELCGEAGGIQDQIAAAFGGLNRIDFDADGYRVRPVIIAPERKQELNDNLAMFFTGFSRFSADIQTGTQKALEEKEYTAAAGGGAVEVTVSGKKELTRIKIDPEAVDPDDVEMLEDMIMAAVNQALRQQEEDSAAMMSKLTGGLGGGFPF